MIDPVQTIDRICRERDVHPIYMVSSIISAIGLNHRDSVRGRQFGKPSQHEDMEHRFDSVHDEIDALCKAIDPQRDPDADPPSSLLETLDLALSWSEKLHSGWIEQWKHEHGQHDAGAAGAELILSATTALRHILRNVMNDLERMGLEDALGEE